MSVRALLKYKGSVGAGEAPGEEAVLSKAHILVMTEGHNLQPWPGARQWLIENMHRHVNGVVSPAVSYVPVQMGPSLQNKRKKR